MRALAPEMSQLRTVGRKAYLSIVLTGSRTISRGSARLVELFLHGKAFTLARELRALAARRGTHESLPRRRSRRRGCCA